MLNQQMLNLYRRKERFQSFLWIDLRKISISLMPNARRSRKMIVISVLIHQIAAIG